MNLQKQLNSICLYSFSSSLSVTGAVWVALLAARGFTLWQIGLAEGVFHMVSLLGEVPSGMAADLLGRRRTLAAGGLLAAGSGLMMAMASHYGFVCAAMGLSALSYNLMSGTREAILYDSLKQAGQESRYLHEDANNNQLYTVGTALGNLASLLAGVLGYAGMYLLDAALGLVRSFCALCMEEPIVTEAQAARDRQPLRTLPVRLAALCRETAEYLLGAPRAVRCIAANAIVTLPCYLTTMLLQQRLVELGLPTGWLGVPMLAVWGMSMAGMEAGRRLHPAGLRRLYALCALVCGGATVLCGAGPMAAAVLGAGLVQFSTNVWMLHSEAWLNEQFPSDQRATLVSVDSMAYSLLMIPVSPLVGLVGDLSGTAGGGLWLLGTAVAASAVLPLALKNYDL